MQEDDAEVTRKQEEALRLAHEEGYFAVPRGASLADLGEEIGVSSQSVSERLRLGLAIVLEQRYETCEAKA